MKKAIIAIIAGVAALYPSSAIAQTISCDQASYIVFPDGRCYDLRYLAVLGDSRTTMYRINALYDQEYQDNLNLERAYIQTGIEEDEEARDARYRSLVETGNVRDESAVVAEEIEVMLFPLHTRTMATFRDAFAP